MVFLNDSTFNYLKYGLDVANLRQDLIASNIANADTPNYKAKHIPFNDILKLRQNDLKLKVDNEKHIKPKEDLDYIVKKDVDDYLVKNDQNNVKLDKELTYLAKNTLIINTLTAFERYKFNEYKDIISSTRNA
ncbi:flagellar basal body rod protein FlgB [Hippea maritima]|uniref:Flagellar basal body rod protein FlgB n=1 Tax=Hippea maritima (strain ATCC 700847 / DSM 10411 / MH2) TaxID=760142 RepID=F2LWY2_HIPMA|nr:flagellar basal body rod protein FlgB [Hippea maritima]AEA34166.1 flagellar basal-body rod protein FlgB [Hippea maritima DSM 10411]